ncbi:MAG TPA: universal stress protein [Bryobacteraceae bacterium]|nr:universal stress protein [Bryobacteraceae bacterium]
MTSPTPTKRGRFKIFLGYAAGVGKTYQMLDEGQELRRKGLDVVIGYFEPHGRQDTIARTEGLETVPRREIVYRGTTFQEMDTDAILKRKPEVCLVDELAHTNVPGLERTKRWQDVQVLLDAGIAVLTSLNIQHLESLNDQIWQMTGVRVRETLPDWVVDQADEIVVVDVTPRALRHRLERGVIYSREKADKALENFFAEHNLSALREIAMRHAAHEIEEKLSVGDGSVPSAGPHDSSPAAQPSGRKECILICIDERPSAAVLIRRGRRVADYLRAECFAIYVSADPALSHLSQEQRESVEKHLGFARNLRIEVSVVQGNVVADGIVEFARTRHATQIFMGRSPSKGWKHRLRGSTLHRVVRLARDMEITIVAERRR